MTLFRNTDHQYQYVGHTDGGPPTAGDGSFVQGNWCRDNDETFVCVSPGTPGQWESQKVSGTSVPLASATLPGIDTQEFWVSKGAKASDANSGDKYSPFATLAHAITVGEATGLGYTIHLGYGSYNFAGATITQVGVRFKGAGEALTSIVGTAAAAMFAYANNTLRCGFDDLIIDGNGIATYGIRPAIGGFIQSWLTNVQIIGCVTAGFANVGNSAYTMTWTNVLVHDNAGNGVVLTAQANNCHFFGCAVYYNGADQMVLGDGTATLAGIVLDNPDIETTGSSLVRNLVLNKAQVTIVGWYGETPGNVGNRDIYITGTGPSIVTIDGFYSVNGGGTPAPYPIEIAATAVGSIVEIKGPLVSGYTTQELVHDASGYAVITTGPGHLNGALDYGSVGPLTTAAFHPLDIAGCQTLLDAEAIPGLKIGDSVPSWPDLSGNGRDATNGTGATQPILAIGSNGKRVVHFDTSKILAQAAIGSPIAQPFTMFFVTNKYTAGAASDGPASGTNRIGVGRNTSIQFGCLGLASGNGPSIDTGPVVMTLVANGAASYLRNSGYQGSNGVTSVSFEGLTLGNNYFAGAAMTGDIAEVIVYSGALSVGDIGRVERYLARKYRVTLA